MRMTTHVNGMTFESAESNKSSASEACNIFYEKLEAVESIQVKLKDGGFLIIGSEAVKNAVIILND